MKNTLTMGYVLRKNNNSKSSVVNRWFAHVDSQGTLSTRGLAQHMVEHGIIGNRGDAESFLAKLSECIPELVAQGYGVKLNGLGIFYPTIANVKGGAESVEKFSITKNIKGVRFRFKADSSDLDDLTTKAFGKKVSFGNGYYQLVTGPKAAKYPMAAASEPTNSGSTNSGSTTNPTTPTGGGGNTGGNGGGGDEPGGDGNDQN